MSLHDMVYGMTSVASGAILNIRPAVSGEVWRVYNIYIPLGSSVEIYRSDSISTAPTLLMMRTGVGIYSEPGFLCNQYEFIAVKNIGGSDIKVSYDGMVIRSS